MRAISAPVREQDGSRSRYVGARVSASRFAPRVNGTRNLGPIQWRPLHGRARRVIPVRLALFGGDSDPGVQAMHPACKIANEAPDVVLAKTRRPARPARFSAAVQQYLSEQTPRVTEPRLDIVTL
jgi:hypothetical protein